MAERLRVATFNTLYYPQGDRWAARLPVAGAALLDLDADVVGLQEIDRAHDRDRALAALVPDRAYVVVRASETQRNRYPRHWDGVVMLIARDAGSVVAARERRLTHLRIVQAIDIRTPGGALVRVANTHLHHPGDPPGVAARTGQMRAILRWIEDVSSREGPADTELLLGDLNATPVEPAIAAVREAGFASTYETANGRTAATFPSGLVASTIAPGPPAVCIDYIWLRGRGQVISSSLAFDRPSADDPTLYPSDHLGIVADIELGGG